MKRVVPLILICAGLLLTGCKDSVSKSQATESGKSMAAPTATEHEAMKPVVSSEMTKRKPAESTAASGKAPLSAKPPVTDQKAQ